MKLTHRRSWQTYGWSPDSSTPLPPAPAGQCSTWNPSRCPPAFTSVKPPNSGFVPPLPERHHVVRPHHPPGVEPVDIDSVVPNSAVGGM